MVTQNFIGFWFYIPLERTFFKECQCMFCRQVLLQYQAVDIQLAETILNLHTCHSLHILLSIYIFQELCHLKLGKSEY